MSYERQDNKEGRARGNEVTPTNPVKIHDAELAHYDLQICKMRARTENKYGCMSTVLCPSGERVIIHLQVVNVQIRLANQDETDETVIRN